MLLDIGLIPCLYQDYSYYLWNPRLKEQITVREEGRKNKEWIDKIGQTDIIRDVLMMDRRLQIAFTIDFLLREDDGRYRIHLSGYRLSQYTTDPDWEMMLARMMLATVRKIRMEMYIHTDHLRIDGRPIFPSMEHRRSDVRDIHRIHAVLDGLEYLRIETSNGRLHPNIKANYSHFFSLDPQTEIAKTRSALSNCDPSIVWQCGNKRRNRLRQSGIYQWDDPRFLPTISCMIPGSIFLILQKMIRLNACMDDDTTIYDIPSSLHERFPYLQNENDKWLFVDFETDFHKCIYLYGEYSPEDGYRNEWGDDISLCSERDLMLRIHDRLRRFQADGGCVAYFYAERAFWRERCRIQQLESLETLFDDAIDIHKIFQHGPVLIRGLFDFKLKHIASALHRHGLITIQQPSGCADGAESVKLAQQFFRTQDPAIKEILADYNRFDCEVLHAILSFLRQ